MGPAASIRLCVAVALAFASVATPAQQRVTAVAAEGTRAGDVGGDLALQILLERVRFSPGEIDGKAGGNTRRAIAGYQAFKGLPVTGEADAGTLAALRADAGDVPLLGEYTLTQEDVDYAYVAIPGGFMAQSRMKALSYSSIQEKVGEAVRSSPALLRTLNPGADWNAAGTVLRVPAVQDLPALAPADHVLVDESDKTLQLVDAQGVAYAQFPITSGTARFPLPVGEWKVTGIAPDPWYNYDPKLISTARRGDRKTRLPPGPNGPVGTMWIGLTKPHYGLHGTPNPHLIGRTQSNGCVRLTNWSAHDVAAALEVGTRVVMQE